MVTQGTTAACLDCFHLGQLHRHILQIEVLALALLASLWYHKKRNHQSKTGIQQGIQWLACVDQGKISLEGKYYLIWLNDGQNIPHGHGVLCIVTMVGNTSIDLHCSLEISKFKLIETLH
jgi:hypothetical protein